MKHILPGAWSERVVVIPVCSRVYRHPCGHVGCRGECLFFLRPGLWRAACHSPVRVEVGLRVRDHVAFELRALPDGYLGIGLECVLDALGLEEAGVNLPVAGGVKLVGIFHVSFFSVVPITVCLAGEVGQAFPVGFRHDGVVDRSVRPGNFQEAGYDTVGGARDAAAVVDVLAALLFSESEFIAFIDNHGVVGMEYLPGFCTEHEFAVAGNGEVAACLVDVAALWVLTYTVVTGKEVAQ